MSVKPPPDQAVRARALDPRGSFIVQAPAGSGKTELLVQRYLALLARVALPENVLAITFTRKAAGEMRDRVLEALGSGGGRWNLAQTPSRLRIQTIDSLAAAIVRRMPWLARAGHMPQVTANAAHLYEEAARRTVRMLDGPADYSSAVGTLALHLDGDVRRLRDRLESLLERRDQWLRHLGSGRVDTGSRQRLESALGKVVEAGLARARSAVPAAILAQLGDPKTLGQWQDLEEQLFTKDGAWRKALPQAARRLVGDAAVEAAFAEIGELPGTQFHKEQWDALEALLTLLPVAAAQLKILFAETGIVDFVEVAEAARRALRQEGGPSDLALRMGERIEHILVDEVQDTSAAQVEMVERLVAAWDGGPGETLFVVGDPMQSIYGFREADVSLFLRARRHRVWGVDLEPLTLEANFRSRPEIVNWVNQAFTKVFPKEENPAAGDVPYCPSLATRDPAARAGVKVHPFFDKDMDAEAAVVGELVAAARTGKVGILVRARAHAVAVIDELKRRRIAYRAVDLDPLAGRPVVNDLFALTRALLDPADRTAWLALLRAPWCGLRLGSLHAIASGNHHATVWDLMAEATLEPGEQERLDRVRRTLAPAVEAARRTGLRMLVERTWLELGGQPSADAARYLDLLEEHERAGAIGIRFLERQMDRLYAAPGEEARVEVMTIHRAKGLQFDTVIVPGLGRGPGRDTKPLLNWAEVDTGDERHLLLSAVEAVGAEEDPVYRYLRYLDKRRAAAESVRLLYVAATRARENLHWLGHVRVEKGKMSQPFAGSLLRHLWPAVKVHFDRAFNARGMAQLPLPVMPAVRTIRRLPASWQPTVAEPAGARHTTFPQDRRPVAGGLARAVGVVLHGFLEHQQMEPAPGSIRAALAGQRLPASQWEEGARRVGEALARLRGDARARWIFAPRESTRTELAATIVVESRPVRCVIDRTFVENGTRWVIDFKSSVPSGDTEEFLASELELYRPQMERYAEVFRRLDDLPVRAALYFPLAGLWCEAELHATGRV